MLLFEGLACLQKVTVSGELRHIILSKLNRRESGEEESREFSEIEADAVLSKIMKLHFLFFIFLAIDGSATKGS